MTNQTKPKHTAGSVSEAEYQMLIDALTCQLWQAYDEGNQQLVHQMKAAPELLAALIEMYLISKRTRQGNDYMERGEAAKAICKALGLDYYSCKTDELEAALNKAKGLP